ncbi:hypothetical protein C2S51_026178 [Perilla frutescens var. frutescens]|nr:hypothetical protein C2S51_026178 [Perilla frutescens var. frutescens]
MDEERMLSILRGEKGYDEHLDISEFKEHLKEASMCLAEEELDLGWVLYEGQHKSTQLQHKIITLLKHIASDWWLGYHHLVQFWALVQVEGRHHYLSTLHHPFSVNDLRKGLCWYRKVCMDHVYVVDMEEGAQVDQLGGGVGRAYQSKQPQSTPDLRLYSTTEFPLRDQAARCGFRGYLALPLFDFHKYECYGVLELLFDDPTMEKDLLSKLDRGLQIVGLRSTHINFMPITRDTNEMHQPESEITEILELATKAIPQLYLAQVWVPCKQCANMSTNLCCMERSSFINARTPNSFHYTDEGMLDYLQACELHNLQIDVSCFSQNLCHFSISKNPLAHYAERARLSLRLAICLKSVHNSNDLYVVEFFLQPKCREDEYPLNLLLRIMEMKLKSFKFVLGGQLPEDNISIECESIAMNSYMEILSNSNFTKYLETIDLCCLRPSSGVIDKGWVFRGSNGKELPENEVNSESLPVKEKIEDFMKKMAAIIQKKYWIVQFWAPKMVEDRCYLETSYQPYALGCLAKGLASFRKKCMKHYYAVDEEAKEDELGPPGRVFRNGLMEITPDLFLYSTKEFSIRNYAVECYHREYFALPVFDENDHKCVGVLEFIGFGYYDLEAIGRALKASKLCSTHIDSCPRFLANEEANNIMDGRIKALTELRDALGLITKIPQLHMANVWVPNGECVGTNNSNSNQTCMELAWSTNGRWDFVPTDQVRWIHVPTRKGIVGMVLASENKSCFCGNLSEFSIVDQPLAHYERRERRNVCFAICLQSSHTGDLLYVLEFFLNEGPSAFEYLRSFLNFLLPIIKQELGTFKMASGKLFGEELVVEVIEFSEANKVTSSELDLQPDVYPIKFVSVHYDLKEHQNIEEPCSSAAAASKRTPRGKRKTGIDLTHELLISYFGKKLDDVSKELGIGKSTIKRACRRHGIYRWPNKEKHTRNSSLFERESSQPSSSSSLQLHTNVGCTQHLNVQEEAEKVMIKVKYEEDTVKFELCLSLGVAKLFEEVAIALNLKRASFKLKYLDEDDDEILLTRDADLQFCPRRQTATGKNCIQLFVQLISK